MPGLESVEDILDITMAASSSLLTYSLQGHASTEKTIKCCKAYMYGNLYSSYSRIGYTKSKFLTSSKFLHNEISSKWGWVEKFPMRNEILCRAVETENSLSPLVTKKFELDDVIEAQQFDREILNYIFEVALDMEKIEKSSSKSQMLKGYLMATLFYEPSTRTRLSFESAMKRLGGEVLTTENAREFSSAAKGETLEGDCIISIFNSFSSSSYGRLIVIFMHLIADTIRTVEGYSDIIVMRHFESGAARKAAATASIPIINAGDGPGQHPTQVC